MDSQNRKLDFVIVGAQKAGTSALNFFLRQHPGIFLSEKKELRFFDNEEIFKDGKPDYSILETELLPGSEGKLKGDCTPNYMFWVPSMGRIWEYNPDIKIIAVLRNPVHRAFSQWNMFKTEGKISEDFYTCLVNENELSRSALPLQHRFYSCIARGFYSEQIRRIYRYFRKEQVLFIKYEDFNSNQPEALNRIFEFLGLESESFSYNDARIFKLEYLKEISREEKEFLQAAYKNEINEVERILGWDCTDWKF